MDTSVLYLLLFGLVVAGANVFGGMILFPSTIRRNYKRLLKYLLGLGAGFMLAVTFFEIIPNSIKLWIVPGDTSPDWLFAPMLLLVVGYLLTQFFEHTIAPHIHLGEELHAEELISTRSAYAGVGGLSMHTFFDGVSIAAASLIDLRIGFLVFLAVFLHKFPEGFTIGSMLVAAGKGRREVIIATALIGSMTILGVLVFYFVGARFNASVAYALPLASGVTLYVAASDLIPEVNHHGGKNPLVSLSVFGGVALFFAIHFCIELLGVH
ncbi:MAG TPA: ZIP family metal transporter [Pyrinomonadaceae bacterium]|nr:ZIP family metal transporter [Pyrinomonadaceae bacterium]